MRILGAWIDAAVVAVWTLVHRLERMQSTWSGRVERERRMTLEVTECLLRGGDNCTRALYERIETCALSRCLSLSWRACVPTRKCSQSVTYSHYRLTRNGNQRESMSQTSQTLEIAIVP